MLAQSLNTLKVFERPDVLRADLTSKNEILRRLQSKSEFISLARKSLYNLYEEERAALVELSKDDTIIISKADKGCYHQKQV